jgi:signal transduction histidine kinase
LIDEIGERAATEERQRIARELHDVIAHTLAVTMLQLTGARLALERDPADAARALMEAERLGRQSLAEIRRTIGLLAPDDSGATMAMPTAVDVPDLVQQVSDAGLCVRWECAGDLTSVAPTSGLAVYRIIQESLSNVARHATGAPAVVTVRVDARDVRVDVRNPIGATQRTGTPPHDRGMGLVLMRERAESVGGTLNAGADGDEWHVSARIPALGPT